MKRILKVAFVFMLLAGAASAQSKQEGHQKQHASELGLSDQQKAEMKRIHEAEKKELNALKANESLTNEQKKESRKAIQEKYRAQFKNVLTAQQQEKAKDLRKDHEGKGHDKAGRDHADQKHKTPKNAVAKHRDASADRGDNMEAELGLSNDQKARVAKSREEFKAKAEAIKTDASLSREQKQAAFKTLSEKQKEEMKAILTKEQIQKMEASRRSKKKEK